MRGWGRAGRWDVFRGENTAADVLMTGWRSPVSRLCPSHAPLPWSARARPLCGPSVGHTMVRQWFSSQA